MHEVSKTAGRLRFFYEQWQTISSDRCILSYIKGLKIPFCKRPYQNNSPKEPNWSPREKRQLEDCLNDLMEKGAISKTRKCKGQFISNIFLRPKSDGSSRLILNLKTLNKYVSNKHFKIEDYKTVTKLIRQDCFMATLDLKDAYFLVSINKKYRKYLRFYFKGSLYQFNCLPFGLNCAPRVFTKIMKPVISLLRSKGLVSNLYLDDFLLLGESFEECQKNVLVTQDTLTKLGFIINFKKSSLVPRQSCIYLGFKYDTKEFTVSLPEEKISRLIRLTQTFKEKTVFKIRDFSSFIGSITSCCPVIPYGWVYTKFFEREKFKALAKRRGNFNSKMRISSTKLSEDYYWWLLHFRSKMSLKPHSYALEIFSDASRTGWGIFCNGQRTHGFWSDEDKKFHINHLELLAAFFGLKCFASKLSDCSILCKIDNKTAIACINRMGSVRYPKLNEISRRLWQWCEERRIFIFASYIKSSDNREADEQSRMIGCETEFELNPEIFKKITSIFGKPDIDLFASRTNKKCETFVSWRRDPESFAIDAFTLPWSNLNFYAFPPFSMLLKVLQKILDDKAEGIVVAPFWTTQPWYPLFTSLLTQDAVFFKPKNNLLLFPDRSPHPLCPQLTLVVGRLSGKRSREGEFQMKP